MKKTFILISLLSAFSSLYAQELEFGVKGGISNNTIQISDMKSLDVATDANNTYNFGLYGRLKIIGIGLYVQPELIYNTRASNFSLKTPTTLNPSLTQIFSHKANYVDVPVLVGWKFLKLFRVYGGPNFQFLLNQNTDIPNVTGLTKEDLKKNTTGIQFGVGLDLLKLRADVKYDFNTSDMGSAFRYNGNAPTLKNGMIMIQIGIKLFGIL